MCVHVCVCVYIYTINRLYLTDSESARKNMGQKLSLISAPCSVQPGWDFLIRSSFPFFPFQFCSIVCSDISCSNMNSTFSVFLYSTYCSGPLPKIIARNAGKKT